MNAGANLEAMISGEGTVLHKAMRWGNVVAVELLLVHGANIDTRMLPNLETPLHVALGRPYSTTSIMVKRIMQLGANAHAETARGETP